MANERDNKEDEELADEGPDVEDVKEIEAEAKGETPTARCQHCKAMIYDEAEKCPKCGAWLNEMPKGSRVGAWIIIGFILAMIALAIYVAMR